MEILKEQYEKALTSYETVSTEVRSDLGDDIKKAFGNIESILADEGLEDTELNKKAVRILGYSEIEITKENKTLLSLLEETENSCRYNQLDEKKTRQLRLLAEELVGMLPHLASFDEGQFWVENSKNKYELHVVIHVTSRDINLKDRVLSISTDGVNASTVGIMGKIKAVIETMAENYVTSGQVAASIPGGEMGYYASQYYAQAWSLANYSNQMKYICCII